LKIEKVAKENIEQMRIDYFDNLIAPMDDMYELGIIPACDFYMISEENYCCGYFCINDNDEMMQFYITDTKKEDTQRIFDYVISNQSINTAIPCTNDPIFYSLCQGKSQSKEEVYCMFISDEASIIGEPTLNIIIDTEVKIEDIEIIFSYFRTIGLEGEWFNDYLNQRIKFGELILFKIDGDIIGSSEIRTSIRSKDYANLGIAVSPDYRRRGLGSYFLSIAIQMAYDKGLKAICGVDKTNIASLNAVEKAGFSQYHSYMKMIF
jgi:ribosomal protein S18 acetylase RimI-like enzyme